MREIKFRAWTVEDKVMIQSDRLCFEQFLPLKNLLNDNNDIQKIMQYTGLKDLNGKEIYEGDIVRTIEKSGVWLSEVRYVVDCFCAGLHTISSYKDIEVIGNIYENPELLEDK